MPNLKRKPKLFPGMQPIPAFFLNAELMEKLQISALQNGRTLIEEIEFRLERDLAREALGPRRSIPVRRWRKKPSDG